VQDQSGTNMDGSGCLWRKSGMEKDRAERTGVSGVVERMRERKREYGFSYGEIASRAGLPLGTVQKVLGGFTKSPRHDTLEALAKVLLPEQTVLENPDHTDRPAEEGPVVPDPQQGYLQNRAKERDIYRKNGAGLYTGMTYDDITAGMLVQEGASVYKTHGNEEHEKKQGSYTIRDREAHNAPQPPELIDGVIYDLAAPTFVHQLIAGEIFLQLQNCIRSHGEKCIPFMASADVRLDRDDKTMVMPDVFVVCDPGRIVGRNGRYLDGAPDLVFEITSPSTRKTDMGIKLEKYRKAGVREYWIVDYEKRKVIVWSFGDDPDVFLYGFDAEVPVGISDGKCRIDFTEIVRRLECMPGWEQDQ